MATTNESLILKEQAELEAAPFFPDFEMPEINRSKPKFHCTGDRLFRDRQDVYRAVVKLLAEPGVSLRTICRELHVSDHTVRSVAAREGIAIATVKKEVLSNITHGLRLTSERVIELAPGMSARDAIVGMGVLSDKMALLSGEPNVNIHVDHKIDFDGLFNKLRQEAEETMKLVKAQMIDGVTDLDGKNLEQKALMNGDHEQACPAENGARNAVTDVNCPFVPGRSEIDERL
jgi:hypothetical protein